MASIVPRTNASTVAPIIPTTTTTTTACSTVIVPEITGLSAPQCLTLQLNPPDTENPVTMPRPSPSVNITPFIATILLLLAANYLFPGVLAYCECGYTLTSNVSDTVLSFTDLMESDFLHIVDVFKDTDWTVQGYAVDAAASRGPYGTNFSILNVVSNPIPDPKNWTGPGVHGGTPGLEMIVSGGIPSNGYVQTAQINSVRTDLMYGSYRFLAQLPAVNGTCASVFDYYNNSQEVDMEALSSEFYRNGTNMINIVQQTPQSAARGFSILGQNYDVENLPFDPTVGQHEYRFDVLPGYIYFYADSILIGIMNGSVPTNSRHLIISHWSNGNPLWSGGPPSATAVMTVAAVKAYFNSSDPTRQAAAATRCTDPAALGAYCPIPDYTSDPGTYFSDFFFLQKNETNGQTVYGKKSDAPPGGAPLDKCVWMITVCAGMYAYLEWVDLLEWVAGEVWV